MNGLPVIIFLSSAVFLIILSVLVFSRHTIKTKKIHQAVEAAGDDELVKIYQLIEDGGIKTENSHAYLLGRSKTVSQDKMEYVYIPEALDNLPWAGKRVQFEMNNGLSLSIEATQKTDSLLGGRYYKAIKVPCMEIIPGQYKNIYLPSRYIANNQALYSALQLVSPDFPESLLSYLVCPGKETYEFEPADQARIGRGLHWVQGNETPVCLECDKLMRYILQIPGNLLHHSGFKDSIIYVFGCNEHDDNIAHVLQKI